MKFNWNQALGSVALSAMALSMIGTGGAMAGRNKSDVIKPDPDPPADKIETGQMLDKGKPRPPSVERGIKDQGVKSGVSEPSVDNKNDTIKDNGVTPPSAEKIETGQMLDKGPRWKPSATAREATPPATGDGTPTSTDIEQGQMLDKGPRWKPSATERRAHSGPGGTPPSTAKKGSNTGLILGATAAAAALAAILASGNNDDRPTSP